MPWHGESSSYGGTSRFSWWPVAPPPTCPFPRPTSDAQGSSSPLPGTPSSIAPLAPGSYTTSPTIFSALPSSSTAGSPYQPSPSTTPVARCKEMTLWIWCSPGPRHQTGSMWTPGDFVSKKTDGQRGTSFQGSGPLDISMSSRPPSRHNMDLCPQQATGVGCVCFRRRGPCLIHRTSGC